MWAIENCRTSVLGGQEQVCPDCGLVSEAYNSCRNRHCPKCQALDQARWLEKRKRRILPTHYFHVVFTLPSELHGLAKRNPRRIYDLLFQAASRTLLQLGRDPKRLGALLGFTAVLHTWTHRDLRYHPHLHCIVSGGGLDPDVQRWTASSRKFLFPVPVLSRLFRGKFLHGLARLHVQGKIQLGDEPAQPDAFDQLRRTLFDKSWVVYVKPPFSGPQKVFGYLGRYTHRVAISNHRIRKVTDESVTLAARDGSTATLDVRVFIARFLQHVLPKGFMKIRHYGLLASTHVHTLLPIAMALLGGPLPPEGPEISFAENWQDLMLALTGLNLRLCPCCGGARLIRIAVPARLPRAPPGGPP
jgi:hypothetical protein